MIDAVEYCKEHINLETTPKYVKKQMQDFLDIADGKSDRYFLSQNKVRQVKNILKLLKMPKGLKAGKSVYECLTGYQSFFITAVLCVVHKENENKRRYELGILEIGRKNFKTYTIASIFIILFLTEPMFSRFFSVAPNGALSKEIREAISDTLRCSPLVYESKSGKRFKILRDAIIFKAKDIRYIPLAFSTSEMDGKLPNCFIADEVGGLTTPYPIEAMRSGQLNILNKLGFIISTKYPKLNNPFESQVDYAKKVLDGLIKDESVFSLLYEPDETDGWETNDLILKQANPVALEIPEIWQDLLEKRTRAILKPDERENFVTKHCNIIYTGIGTETYIDLMDLKKCSGNIDWHGKDVYLGLDLSESEDNTSVGMVSLEDGILYARSVAFIPQDSIEKKTISERVDYKEMIRNGYAIPCGNRIISYKQVEEYILNIEKTFGVNVIGCAFDKWNAYSSAQKLEAEGVEMVEMKQHSSALHPATKFIREKIMDEHFRYDNNLLLEINFQNARLNYDTNKNMYVNKKKSAGKVDMVVSLINATALLLLNENTEEDEFLIQY